MLLGNPHLAVPVTTLLERLDKAGISSAIVLVLAFIIFLILAAIVTIMSILIAYQARPALRWSLSKARKFTRRSALHSTRSSTSYDSRGGDEHRSTPVTSEANSKLVKLTSENAKLATLRNDSVRRISELQEQVSLLERSIKTHQLEASAAEERRKSLMSQLETIERTLDNALNHNRELQFKYQSLLNEVRSFSSVLEEIGNDMRGVFAPQSSERPLQAATRIVLEMLKEIKRLKGFVRAPI